MVSNIEIFMSIIIVYCFLCTTELNNVVINLYKRGTFRLLWLFFVSDMNCRSSKNEIVDFSLTESNFKDQVLYVFLRRIID